MAFKVVPRPISSFTSKSKIALILICAKFNKDYRGMFSTSGPCVTEMLTVPGDDYVTVVVIGTYYFTKTQSKI